MALIDSVMDSLPREHTRGIERVRLVEAIMEPRLRGMVQASELPGLYHPRQGPKGPWLEVAIGVLLPGNKPIHKRIIQDCHSKEISQPCSSLSWASTII